MTLWDVVALLVSLAALFGYLNHRLFRLPSTIGLTLFALLLSLSILALGASGWDEGRTWAAGVLARVDFSATLMHGLLSFLLFAGALHTDLDDLRQQRWIIGILATIGVATSTLLIGAFTYGLLSLFGSSLSFLHCLLFGALIAPTDPIAVLGIMKGAGAPESLTTKITGESLFNDGVAVVVFLVLLQLATGTHTPGIGEVVWLFVEEVVGGVLFGLAIGGLAYAMLNGVDRYEVEVLITLAVVTGGYAAAQALHLSGPLAMVVSGLLIGNHGRLFAMSERTREHLDTFWELLDEILNAVLFLLIGLELLVLALGWSDVLLGAVLIPLVLLARWLSVWWPVAVLRMRRTFTPGAVQLLTWGGLRGGISVALALSLPEGPARETFLPATYIIAVFSILVQGLTVGRLVRAVTAREGADLTAR